MQFLRQMIFQDDSFPAPGESASFATGDTGMYLGPPSTLNALSESTFDFDLVPQPEGTVGFNPFFGQAGLVVFRNSSRPALATELLAYFSSEESSRTLGRFFVPPRKALLTPETVAELNPALTPESAARTLIDPLPEVTQLTYPVKLPELNSAVAPVLDGLWTEDADVEATLASACETAEPILASQQ